MTVSLQFLKNEIGHNRCLPACLYLKILKSAKILFMKTPVGTLHVVDPSPIN